MKEYIKVILGMMVFVVIFSTAGYITAEPITVLTKKDGSQWVVETSQGPCYRGITEFDLREGIITYVEE